MKNDIVKNGRILLCMVALLALAIWFRHVARPDMPPQAIPASPGHGIWLAHGWLGDDAWFAKYGKGKEKSRYRTPEAIRNLAATLHWHGITDLFPHLGPTTALGDIQRVDHQQVIRFLSAMRTEGLRVMPWVGGVQGKQVFLNDPSWRHNFTQAIAQLLQKYPEVAGIHLNIEPWPSGDAQLLALLEDIRSILPHGKILSVAAYPPPTIWQPSDAIHWDEHYFLEVASRVDQMAVMLYDTAVPFAWAYRHLVAAWTKEVLAWSSPARVLLGVPAYDDAGVGYHDPEVENLENSLAAISQVIGEMGGVPAHFQGVAVYSEWEMDEKKWQILAYFMGKKSMKAQ